MKKLVINFDFISSFLAAAYEEAVIMTQWLCKDILKWSFSVKKKNAA